MTRKKTFVAILLLLCLLIIPVALYTLAPSGAASSNDDEIPDDLDDIEGGRLFVVPEIPIGTLGLVSASISALGLFALLNRRREQP